jgi:hypothetical protein
MDDPQKDARPEPLDPAARRIVARVRRLMLISGLTTFIAIAAVFSAIGYRVFRGEGSAAQGSLAEVTAVLPQGARVVAISAAGERIVVTIEVAGALEARTYDARTLAPTGRLRFATEP